MLRVETSNLAVDLAPRPPAHSIDEDRWCLRLELKDDEIAKLYAQGLTRGALVWRRGMPEWRPLLVAPELSNLLWRTRITLTDSRSSDLDDEVTLPRPARLPSSIALDDPSDEESRTPPTVAPTALDVPAPSTRSAPRRHGELVAVAALGFALAWFARGSSQATLPTQATVAAAAPLTQPAATPLQAPAPTSTIPIIAITDLPLLGAGDAPVARARPARSARTSESKAAGPSRSALTSALGQVTSIASRCGDRGGPVRVVISFANTGVARSIQVSGEDLPAPTRSCIVGAASRARIPTFSGEPVTVSKTL